MNLPFSLEQFLAVFTSYNEAVWPAQVVLNLLAVTAIVLCLRPVGSSRIVAGSLAILWAWTGAVYHFMFFRTINPAAVVFGSACIVQAGLFFYTGVVRGGLQFRVDRTWQSIAGWIFIAYGLLVYPLLGVILGHVYPASPTFGAPCPTTIFTFGLLVWTVGRLQWYLYVIPLIWSVVGFTAAFKLGIREDVGLLVTGVAGAMILAMFHRPAESAG
jgi:hypothetical protein